MTILLVDILNQRQLVNTGKYVPNGHFCRDPSNLERIKYFDLLFCHNHSLANPDVYASLNEIDDLRCITSRLVAIKVQLLFFQTIYSKNCSLLRFT